MNIAISNFIFSGIGDPVVYIYAGNVYYFDKGATFRSSSKYLSANTSVNVENYVRIVFPKFVFIQKLGICEWNQINESNKKK